MSGWEVEAECSPEALRPAGLANTAVNSSGRQKSDLCLSAKKPAHLYSYTPTNVHAIHTHAHIHIHSHKHTNMYTHYTHTFTQTLKHTLPHTLTQTLIHPHTHTHTHTTLTHTYTRTPHTSTHAHMHRKLSNIFFKWLWHFCCPSAFYGGWIIRISTSSPFLSGHPIGCNTS